MDPPASHRVSRVRRYSGTTRRSSRIRVRGSNPVPPAFPCRSASARFCNRAVSGPTTPAAPKRRRFGLLPFRSPLLGESFLFSPPAGTEMFQFPAFPSRVRGMPALCRRVAPFGDPRIIGRLRLPADFRSLPRPSSPAGAKASTMRLFPLRMPAAPLRRRGPFVFLSCSNMSMTSPAATPRE